MNLTAYKVVFKPHKAPRGNYLSAVERGAKNCVTYRLGEEAQPNQGANKFLCIFRTLAQAQAFNKAVFKKRGEGVILEVLAKRMMVRAKDLTGETIRMKIEGHLFCRSCIPVRRIP